MKVTNVTVKLSPQSGDRLKEWLEKYSLGTLWSMGEIGGNRWSG